MDYVDFFYMYMFFPGAISTCQTPSLLIIIIVRFINLGENDSTYFLDLLFDAHFEVVSPLSEFFHP